MLCIGKVFFAPVSDEFDFVLDGAAFILVQGVVGLDLFLQCAAVEVPRLFELGNLILDVLLDDNFLDGLFDLCNLHREVGKSWIFGGRPSHGRRVGDIR